MDLLGERDRWAGRVLASEPADLQLNRHADAAHRDVSKATDIAAMDSARPLPAPTPAALRSHPGPEHHGGRTSFDLIDDEPGQVREQLLQEITRIRNT